MKITQNLGIFSIEMHVFFEVFVHKGYESRAVPRDGLCNLLPHPSAP